MGHKDGGECGDPFIHGCEELSAACRTTMEYKGSGWCVALCVHSCRELAAACRIVMGYRPGISVFPYL